MSINYAKSKKPTKYGIKSYGTWDYFHNAEALRCYLIEWIRGTDGSERDRAVTALMNFEDGIYLTDTDAA